MDMNASNDGAQSNVVTTENLCMMDITSSTTPVLTYSEESWNCIDTSSKVTDSEMQPDMSSSYYSEVTTNGMKSESMSQTVPSTSQQYYSTQTNHPIPEDFLRHQQCQSAVNNSFTPVQDSHSSARVSSHSPPSHSPYQQQSFTGIPQNYGIQAMDPSEQPDSNQVYAYQQAQPLSQGLINQALLRAQNAAFTKEAKVDPKATLVYIRNRQPRSQPQIRPKLTTMNVNIDEGPPAAPVPDAWCHAYYYELNQRVGEPFKGGKSHVIVDGFCAPSEAERFCLGALANVNRNPGVINARRQIGRGVRIFRRGEDVFAECLSEAPVFIQSPIHAVHAHDHPATVYRLPSGHTMQIFDSKSFDALLEQSASQGFHAVYSLQRMCHMRISFVKGWGEQYKRQTITSTPCWVEIHLPVPLQKLDRLLSKLSGPNEPVHSFT
ncbi:hypothetical protein AB6A40_006463 [Gnathostoma spinigerum]|uniref:MH2 domain-containing protein n=1 Tax=Gnathostoma spinigerum TaxID=75299 RepID=A0ABD6EIF7_9BILA